MQRVDIHFRDRRRRRVVAANQEADHGRMVTQQTRLGGHGFFGHLHVGGIPGRSTGLGGRLPFVATLPARKYQYTVAVGEVVETLILQLAFAADGVEAEVEDVTEFGLHACGVVTQEHVRRPATAADQQWFAVDGELAITLLGQAGTDAADAERRRGAVGCCAVDRSSHLKLVQRMVAHADRPPDLGVIQCEAWGCAGRERNYPRFARCEVHGLLYRNASHGAADDCVVRRRIEILHVHLHGQHGMREIGQRQRRLHLWIAQLYRSRL